MSMRDWMNNNSAMVTIGAVVLLCLSLAFLVWSNSSESRPQINSSYYYDLGTGRLFVAGSREIPPIQAESGENAGVRAYVYGCGECPPASEIEGKTREELAQVGAHLVYVEKYTPRAKQILQEIRQAQEQGQEMTEEGPMREMMAREQGRVLSPPEEERWVLEQTGQGMQLMSRIGQICSSGRPKLCNP